MNTVIDKSSPIKFEWNKHNRYKNWKKHKVDYNESEEVFFNKPLKTFYDIKHSQKENRFIALGITNKVRKLYIAFTIRNKKIRVISARNMSRKEGSYMSKNKKPKFVPKFKNEDEERKFWATHDLTDYLHQFRPVKLDLSKLKPSTRPITIRLSESLLASLKTLANKKDVPYQSLMKIFLTERVKKEFRYS